MMLKANSYGGGSAQTTLRPLVVVEGDGSGSLEWSYS